MPPLEAPVRVGIVPLRRGEETPACAFILLQHGLQALAGVDWGSALWCNSCSAQNLDLTGRADENVSVKGWWTAIVEMPVWRGPFRQQTCKCGGAC